MILRRLTTRAIPLLAIGTAFALALPAHAQDRPNYGSRGTTASLRVNIGTTLHWSSIQGTRVEEIQPGERQAYDMFRYGGRYYAYDSNRWYSSPQESGDFVAIDDASVPSEFTNIPSDHWRNYPSSWQSRRDAGRPDRSGISGSLRVSFGNTPRWTSVQGTRVEEIQPGDRQQYDMFRYGGRYYAYDNNRWYSSSQESGDFVGIDEASVPTDFANIPSDHWRNYPSSWQGRRNSAPPEVSGSLQVDLGDSPRWSGIQGTGVREIRQGRRPDYDVFAYNGSYYAYNNDRWYMSHQRSGQFIAIDDRDVPGDFTRIPRSHWRNDPSGWQDRRSHRPDGSSASLQISFGSAPRWYGIRGSRVREIRGGQRPDYDMFGFAGSYYVYRDSRWYSSRRSDGEFSQMNDRDVPREISRVPRSHWRNYPSSWSNR